MAGVRTPVSLCILALTLTAACGGRGATPRPFPGAAVSSGAPEASRPGDASPPVPLPAPSTAEAASPPPGLTPLPAMTRLVQMALGFRGVPYRNGGTDPSGFDCSGLVQYVFARNGVPLPREVRDQFRAGSPIDRERIEPGDLLFFETVSRGASHVGIAIGGVEFVHAPSSRGVVRVERFTTEYWAKRWVGARRVILS